MIHTVEIVRTIIECPSCGGKGCTNCEGVGSFELVGCPHDYADEMIDFVQIADLFNDGCPPVAGGSLDQASWFVDAARRLKSEEQAHKGELDG